jgi:hypothetical protein
LARIRTIKPDFFFDEKVSELDHKSRLAFIGLWCYADKEGRMEDKPKVLKAKLFPYENVDFDKILDALTVSEFIIRYTAESKKYILINNFCKHQRPHHTEKDSEIPDFNGDITVKQPDIDGEEKVGRERKGKERKGVYGGFRNVLLTENEYSKLQTSLGSKREEMIERLSGYIASKGTKYKSHYATILNWSKRDKTDNPNEPKYKEL